MDTMLQYFEWYLPDDGTLWNKLKDNAKQLADDGYTMVWMPPAYKGQAGSQDVGYGVYDMYDLGEFDAKGSVRTKYGTVDEYKAAVKAVNDAGMTSVADIVFNHRMGADEKETVMATDQNWDERNQAISGEHPVDVWTKFTFPARNGKYSDFTWDWHDFSGTDFDDKTGSHGLLLFNGKTWDRHVSKEQGNFDYIMGADVDFHNENVTKELFKWGLWYLDFTGVDGFRLDAVKSIDAHFFYGWLSSMRTRLNKDAFAVGEYWSPNVDDLRHYLDSSSHCMNLFDVPLHSKLCEASQKPGQFDFRTLFEGTLTGTEPEYAVAFSDNHDTQPGQALQSFVEPWFKPMSYAILLLRNLKAPCVFYGDLYGIPHDNIEPTPWIKEMVWIRKNLLGEGLKDYTDGDPNRMAWVVKGDHPLFVLFSTSGDKEQPICEPDLANTEFVSLMDPNLTVRLDENGNGAFSVKDKSLNVFMKKEDLDKVYAHFDQKK